jgi:formylglycine-generating enzyme required for sulfatase activity
MKTKCVGFGMMLLTTMFIVPNAWAGGQVPAPEMVSLPGGTFRMGSIQVEVPRQRPVHTVSIRPFAIGKFEVTFEEYDAFATATGGRLPNDGGFGRGKQPVIDVSWHDAIGYAEWLSGETGKHYRLPTEAEWEYAARAGTETLYWWGTELGSNRANCRFCGSKWDKKKAAPVGSFAANPFGLHDTAGNATEWVQDCWHGNYEGAPTDGSARLASDGGVCANRVFRGGSMNSMPVRIRSESRGNGGSPDGRAMQVGFRLAQDLE